MRRRGPPIPRPRAAHLNNQLSHLGEGAPACAPHLLGPPSHSAALNPCTRSRDGRAGEGGRGPSGGGSSPPVCGASPRERTRRRPPGGAAQALTPTTNLPARRVSLRRAPGTLVRGRARLPAQAPQSLITAPFIYPGRALAGLIPCQNSQPVTEPVCKALSYVTKLCTHLELPGRC